MRKQYRDVPEFCEDMFERNCKAQSLIFILEQHQEALRLLAMDTRTEYYTLEEAQARLNTHQAAVDQAFKNLLSEKM